LQVIAAAHESTVSTHLFDAHGRQVLASSYEGLIESGAISDGDMAQLRRGEMVISPILPSNTAIPDEHGRLRVGVPTMTVSAPVRDADKSLIAILTVRIDVLGMTALESHSDVRLAGAASLDVYMVNQAGVVLTPTAFEDELRDAGRIRHRTQLELSLTVPGTNQQTRAMRMCRRIAGGDPDAPWHDMQPYRDYRGVDVVGAWHPVRDTDWFVIAEVDHGELTAPMREVIFTTLLLTAVICAIVALIAAAVTRLLLKPIRQLITAADRLASGDLKARCAIQRDDELGQLGAAFDTMADTIERTLAEQHDEIMERRKAEAALRITETRYRTLFETAPHAILIGDGMQMIDCNQAALDMFGFDNLDEARQRGVVSMSPLCQPDGSTSSVAAAWIIAETYRTGSMQFEWTHCRKNGQTFPAEVTLHTIEIDGRQLIQAAVRDITQRRLEEDYERERAALAESCKAMEQVLGVVGHELRTPLAALRAIAELLIDHSGNVDQSTASMLEMMHGETLRMARFLDDVLEAARLNSGRARWNWQNLQLADVCRSAIGLVRSTHDNPDVAIACDLHPKNLTMHGDGDAIARLIVNLVNNAAKYTTQGSIDVAVKPRYTADGRMIELTVRDTGTGIEPDVAAKLGQAFALNSGMVGAESVRGTGLGLSICVGIAAAHGGKITVESQVGQGTTFTVTLCADLSEPMPVDTESRILTESAA
jgi:PAS domain S-box-containing protein